MKHAFLILAHSDPEQLEKLINALDSENSFFYIHWDKKNEYILEVSPILKKLSERTNIFFIKNRIKVYWGGFSIVKATILLIKEASMNLDISYFHLLSGIDYPLKSKSNIFDFFMDNEKNYISYIPEESNFDYFINRYYFYDNDYINPQNKNNSIKRTLISLLLIFIQRCSKVLVEFCSIRIRKKLNMNYYHGTQWFSLHKNAITYILNFIKSTPWILKRFEYTAVSDESFFIMILMNNPELRRTVVNNDLRLRLYNGMPNRGGYVLTEKDYELIKNSDALFGRKFVTGKSDRLIQLISDNL